MRRKRKLVYYVDCLHSYWWQGGKLVPAEEVDYGKHISSHKTFYTKKKAIKAALKGPVGTRVTCEFWQHGMRYAYLVGVKE